MTELCRTDLISGPIAGLCRTELISGPITELSDLADDGRSLDHGAEEVLATDSNQMS
jgi:hypothetical protein